MPRYDYRATEVTVSGVAVVTQLLRSNPNRVSLLITNQDTSGNVAFCTIQDFASAYVGLVCPINFQMAYRDYGALVQEAVWVSINPAPRTFRLLEVIQIPGS